MGELISDDIPNLAGGVSQQPAAIRRENQFEAQTNAFATLVEGLSPRRPTHHVTQLIASEVGEDALLHFINRDPGEQYVAAFLADGTIRVWDLLTGDEKTVTNTTPAYVTTASPKTGLKAVTVADYTFVVNTATTVAATADITTNNPPECLINVKQGNYGKAYRILVDGVEAALVNTGNGGDPSDAPSIDTVNIATLLSDDLILSLGADYTVVRYASTIWFSRVDGAEFTVSTEDGYSGLAMIPIKDKVPRFTDLPQDGREGFVVGVTGDQGLQGDIYYLKFTPQTGSFHGVWEECAAKGVLSSLDPATMPHTLVRNADGTFTFDVHEWGDRDVGDLTTNPWPTFVDHEIKDVFFARNRLGFLAGENVQLSRVGKFFDFFRKTVTTLVDDDPVDTASTSARVANMQWAIPFDKDVILFSDQGQYQLGAQGVLTPRTAAIVPTSEYESSRLVRPTTTGTSVFFVMERSGYAQVREYWNDGQSASKVLAFNATEHVPSYIIEGVHKITASRSENAVAVLTDGDPTAIYLYNYLGDPANRVQSAWTRWEMGGIVRGAEFFKANLYVVIERDGATWLEYIPLASGTFDPLVGYLTYLDRKVTEVGLTGSYDADLDYTTVTLPYASEGVRCLVRAAADYEGALLPGQEIKVVSTAGNDVVLLGDHTDTPMYFGFVPETRIRLSTMFPRERTAERNTMTTGRLQLRYLAFQVAKTAYFRVEVKPLGRPMFTKTFNGRVVGSGTTIVGAVPLYNGKVSIPIMSNAGSVEITIVHDSPLPMNILSMEWTGLYVTKSQRV